MLVDIAGHALVGRDSRDAYLDGSDAAAVPVCGITAVADSCRVIRHGDTIIKPQMAVKLSQLAEALGLCKDLDQVEWLIKTLKLKVIKHPTTNRREYQLLDCFDLCEASVAYLKSSPAKSRATNKLVVPPTSDTTCYRSKDGQLLCDVAVAPEVVKSDMAKSQYYGGKRDKEIAKKNNGGGTYRNEGLGTGSVTFSNCPFREHLAVVRVAQLFRVYPRRIDNDRIDSTAVSADQSKRAYQNLAKGEAWLSLTLRAMINYQTVDERQTYFSGKGPLDKEEVRSIVWRVLAYALTSFMDGLTLRYPGQHCQPLVLAYVVGPKYGSDDVFEPNPVGCTSTGECGKGPDGRYHVHLCPDIFKNGNEVDFASVLVHEVVHHAGPRDISYKLTTLQRDLNQTQQLDNAANYQYFFRDVIAEEDSSSQANIKVWKAMANSWKAKRARRKARRKARRDKRKAKWKERRNNS